ncbi:MAG: hypothetical protein PHZ07_02640 [Patescibacteria group bacterium]|nr:hypothetical protein [Patescibacteria group bacterium]MDD4304682.1 hypothetical protein [Patescibacteria group bacterium]MDD4695350.1 hypothetical protein [Patescibacteria group bacterium]
MDLSTMLPKKLIQKCPVCGKEYNFSKIKVLCVDDASILSYLKCVECDSGVALKILLMPTGVIGQAIITDLDGDEIMAIKEKKNIITSSDVLLVYDFFKTRNDLLREIK